MPQANKRTANTIETKQLKKAGLSKAAHFGNITDAPTANTAQSK